MHFKKYLRFIFGFIALVFLSSAYANTKPQVVESETAIQNAVLVHINTYRKQHGLPPLKMDNNMVREAKQHSLDMAAHRMPFGHQDFSKRITRLHKQIKNTGAGAENVAYNYKNAQIVVQQWLRSSGHKRNIVGNYDLTGIGVARDKQGKLYYTQLFLRTTKETPRVSTHATRRAPFGVSFGGISFRRSA
ncbi:CAP domain-containing protein [Legionella lytica]|uniref:CAP domain-containing protein n=1 Tax=Legionella lytica TaxID=96232 RepID=A0ABY4Y8C4_9GAMM|nr:CAP domain-containing protein [Legionella lytica]USQ13349.1 CAP domain-containing protein [Legionella lytica]